MNFIKITTFAIVVSTSCICLFNFFNSNKECMNLDSIREEIIPVIKESTYEYNFTELLYFSDANEAYGWKIPFTENKYVAKIDGCVAIGINGNNMTYEPVTEHNVLRKVTFKVPHSQVLYIDLDNSSLVEVEVRNGLFNDVTPEDYNNLLKEVKKKQKQKVEENNTLDLADQRIRKLLNQRIHSIYGNDVKVEVQFI